VLEQREGVVGVVVLAEDDDAHVGVGLAEAVGGADALVGAGGGHADVGEDDVGVVLVDGGVEGVEVGAGGDDAEVVLGFEEAADAFADEVVVFGEREADQEDLPAERQTEARRSQSSSDLGT
jgi:hypothetical protein